MKKMMESVRGGTDETESRLESTTHVCVSPPPPLSVHLTRARRVSTATPRPLLLLPEVTHSASVLPFEIKSKRCIRIGCLKRYVGMIKLIFMSAEKRN